MNKSIYTIYDTVAMECNGPFLANNDTHARMIFDRAISEAAKNGFKQEYKLLFLGFFDIVTGEIKSVGDPTDVTFRLEAEDEA